MKFKNANQRKAVMANIRNMGFSQLSRQGIKLKRYGDADKDGRVNQLDCAPLNPKRHYSITHVPSDVKGSVMESIGRMLKKKGYSVDVELYKGQIMLRNIRVDTDRRGHNWRQKWGDGGYKRTNNLSWDDWVEVNDTVNDTLDKFKVNANVKSLGGKFDIRDRDEGRRNENDWSNLEYENVGSMMNPITRKDLIVSKNYAIATGELTKKQLKMISPKKQRRKAKQIKTKQLSSPFQWLLDANK